MNMLDVAAKKFHEVEDGFHVWNDPETKGQWIVKDAEGRIVRTPTPITSESEADIFRDQTAAREAVIALVREIISPDRLNRAAREAGCMLRKDVENNLNRGKKPSLALLEGLIIVMGKELHGA